MVFPFRRCGRRCVCLKGFLTLSFIFCFLSFSACSGTPLSTRAANLTSSATEAQNLPLLKPHVLTIGSYTNYLPQEYLDAQGEPAGFDIDLINAISHNLSVRPEIVSDDFQSLITDLLARRFDVVISAVSITPELQQEVDFVPYFRGGQSLLVAQGNPLHIHLLSDLCGKTVAVKQDSSEQRALAQASDLCRQDKKVAITIVVISQYMDVLHLFQLKHVAAAYEDSSMVDYYINLYPQLFSLGGAVIGTTVEGILLRKNDSAMLAAINLSLQALQANGTYHALISKWGLYRGDIMLPANYDTNDNDDAQSLRREYSGDGDKAGFHSSSSVSQLCEILLC
jgi:polar amino acid transport system substrate-binding protein